MRYNMPSLKLETSVALNKEDEKKIALEIGTLAAQMLNKPIAVVQVRVQSGVTMAFGGEITEKSAFLSFALIGNIAPEVKAVLPEKFAPILEKYGIDAKKIFLNYTETAPDAWGWL